MVVGGLIFGLEVSSAVEVVSCVRCWILVEVGVIGVGVEISGVHA